MEETDYITGIKQRSFSEKLIRDLIRVQQYFSLIFIDIDHFKAINDIYGHTKGDLVLKHFVTTVSSFLRSSDTLTRFGGDEFLIILPQTKKAAATKIAKRLLEEVRQRPFEGFNLSFSYGISTFPSDGREPFTLVEVADKKLYEMKAHTSFDSLTKAEPSEPVMAFGRETERSTVLNLVRRSLNGSGSFIIVSGPLGIGKTFFVAKVISEVRGMFTHVIQTSMSKRNLKNELSFLKAFVTGHLEESFDKKLRDFESFKKFSNFEDILFNSITETISEASQEGPILYYIENAEFMDSLSFSFLPSFLDTLSKLPVFVIATYTGLVPSHIKNLERKVNFRLLELRNLDREAVRKTVLSVTKAHKIDTQVLDSLVKNSGGNPLLVLEITKAAIGEGVIVKKGLELVSDNIASIDMLLADTGYGKLLVDRLGKDEKRILELIAVNGGELNSRVLGKLVERIGISNFDVLEKLTNEGVIKEEANLTKIKTSAVTLQLLSFISEPKKIALLLTTAKMEKRSGEKWLLEDAVDKFIAAGEIQEAKRLLLQLAEDEERSLNLFEAVQKCKRAIQLSTNYGERVRISKRAMAILSRIGRGQEIIDIYNSYLTTCENDAEIMLRVAEAYDNLGEYNKALEILNGLRTRKKDIKVNATVLKAWVFYTLGKIQEAYKAINAINYSYLEPHLLVYVNNIKGILEMETGNYQEAINIFEQSLDTAKKYRKETALAILNNLANALIAVGMYERAIIILKEVISDSEKMYNSLYSAIALYNLGSVFLEIGDLNKAGTYFSKAHSISRKINNPLGIGYYHLSKGISSLARTNLKSAKNNIEQALNMFERLGAAKEMNLAKSYLIVIYGLLNDTASLEANINETGLRNGTEEEALILASYARYYSVKGEKNRLHLIVDALESADTSKFSVSAQLKILRSLTQAYKTLRDDFLYNKYLSMQKEIAEKVISGFSNEQYAKIYARRPEYI